MGSEYTRTGAFRATSPTSVQLDIPIVPNQERFGFNIRKFASRWNLDGAKGGGAHMWREVWDDDVSLIYRDILGKFFFTSVQDAMHSSSLLFFSGMEEPIFGRPLKVDTYAQIKQEKKYIS